MCILDTFHISNISNVPETIKENHINVNNGDVNGTMQYFL